MRSQNSVNPSLNKLYSILRELDCELQGLGVRSDVGIFPTPSSARETLTCCLLMLAEEPNAAEGYLIRTAHALIDQEIERKAERPGDVRNCEAICQAHEANVALFAELLAKYREGFTHDVRTNYADKGVLAAK